MDPLIPTESYCIDRRAFKNCKRTQWLTQIEAADAGFNWAGILAWKHNKQCLLNTVHLKKARSSIVTIVKRFTFPNLSVFWLPKFKSSDSNSKLGSFGSSKTDGGVVSFGKLFGQKFGF